MFVPTQQHLFGILLAVLAGIPAAVPLARAAESTVVDEDSVDRMIDLNKKAFIDIQNQRFYAAKYRLTEAMVISETAGLDNDEMMARTYVHLAVVHLTGFKDRNEAVKQFKLALTINPNITITPGLESPALKSAYLEARELMQLPPEPDETISPSQPVTTIEPILPPPPVVPIPNSKPSSGIDDPDLPARVPKPLHCPLPFEIPPGRDLVVRCVTQKQQKRSTAIFYYRAEGSTEEYVALPMDGSPKGWLVAVIPGKVIQGKSLSYYVKGHTPGLKDPLYVGQDNAPNTFIIKRINPDIADSVANSSIAANAGQTDGKAMGTSYRRTPVSVWFSIGMGGGAAYHNRQTVDSDSKLPGTETPVPVESGFSIAERFQIEPEFGFQVTNKVSLSIMFRYQYAPHKGEKYLYDPKERTVLTSAFAGFVRGHYAFFGRGNFQVYASGGGGIGTCFLGVVKKHCNESSCNLKHSDTLHGGLYGLTAGLGTIYNLSPNFGVFFDLKEIVTLSTFMALTEWNVGLMASFKLRLPSRRRGQVSTNHVSWR